MHTVLLLVDGGIVEALLHNPESRYVALDHGRNGSILSTDASSTGLGHIGMGTIKLAAVFSTGDLGRYGVYHDAIFQGRVRF